MLAIGCRMRLRGSPAGSHACIYRADTRTTSTTIILMGHTVAQAQAHAQNHPPSQLPLIHVQNGLNQLTECSHMSMILPPSSWPPYISLAASFNTLHCEAEGRLLKLGIVAIFMPLTWPGSRAKLSTLELSSIFRAIGLNVAAVSAQFC